MVTGNDGIPRDEVELPCDVLVNDDEMRRPNSVIKYLTHSPAGAGQESLRLAPEAVMPIRAGPARSGRNIG